MRKWGDLIFMAEYKGTSGLLNGTKKLVVYDPLSVF
jgi:hypothetical protein